MTGQSDRIPRTRTLELIRDLQPQAVEYIRRYGFVMDKVGPITDNTDELTRWKVLAFSLYTDLVEASMAAERLIEASAASSEPPALDVERLARAALNVERLARAWEQAGYGEVTGDIDEAAAYGGAAPERLPSVEARLLDLAMSVRRMVEDGHPDSPEWFRIMCERAHAVDDITDAALMEGEDAALASLHEGTARLAGQHR